MVDVSFKLHENFDDSALYEIFTICTLNYDCELQLK